MNTLLPWAFVATLPGLVATACGRGPRPGIASLPGPVLVFAAGLLWLLGDQTPLVVTHANWLPLLGDAAFVLRLDALAAVMLCVVGAVSTCVYVYSLEYMRHDAGQRRFFALLDFFVATMCLLVLAGNLVVLLAGWAGVGLASFLLISFWREKPEAMPAGLQALAANAIGDAALLLAIALLPAGAGDLTSLHTASLAAVPGGASTLAALLVIAAAAKSAQGPLYFWLPSAMAGPTPVSALIHAATMVAAGVYLLCRTFPLLSLAPGVLLAVAWIGVITALLAGIGSLQQPNYKRGLAYSTLSQLGYMFAAVGFHAPFAAFFHLLTHASFKALLFLVAGVVIHAADGEERLARLGGLRTQLKSTALLAFIGSMALIGLPVLTAGAFSKDLILEAGFEHAPALGGLLLLGVVLTGLYTGRLWFAVFGRSDSTLHAHAPGACMTLPLAVLALGACGLGWLGPQLGALLQGSLFLDALGTPPAVHAWSSLGALAGALGAGGFLIAGLWVRKAGSGACMPALVVPWIDATRDLSALAARRVAGVHDGRLVGYLFCCVVGTGLTMLLSRLGA
ncbi:MAG TPA: NADH-quinone oxidoreductase subunit L [Planctomycetota bacterium]